MYKISLTPEKKTGLGPATETGFPFWLKSFQKENFFGKKENRNEKQAEKWDELRPEKL